MSPYEGYLPYKFQRAATIITEVIAILMFYTTVPLVAKRGVIWGRDSVGLHVCRHPGGGGGYMHMICVQSLGSVALAVTKRATIFLVTTNDNDTA